ncbi:hypothetical protein [Brevibacterium linens]|uniref:hypothetical protein n=1 Tax=Brevibacterium linens TaxID=1703 RepID=UPI00126A4F26|nr:hypothetical protein [Brevibacterium linens]
MSTELDLLPAAIGAGGVVVGALVTTLISALNSILQRRFDSHIATRDDRVRQYFEAVDTLHEARDALLKFKEANSGLGVDEGKRKSIFPWKNHDYHAYDQQAAESFTRLLKAAEQVAIQRARIDVVGSLKAADAFERCYGIIDAYLQASAEELIDDGWFRIKTWEDYWENYNSEIEATVKLFRKDLKTKNE